MPPERTARRTAMTKHRAFGDLHTKDQQIKQTKKLCIEQNWQTKIEICLPAPIRPRVEVKKGAKARVGDEGVREEKWWNWSVELLKAIEELSSMTEGDHVYAQQLLEIEVEQRQNNPKSSQRKILELLLGDAQKVVDEQRKRLAVKYTADGMNMGADSVDPRYDTMGYAQPQPQSRTHGMMHREALPAPGMTSMQLGDTSHQALPGPQGPYFADNYHQALITDRPHNSPLEVPRDTFADHASTVPGESLDELYGHLSATEARARAAKLRAEALRIEAEALEVEAKARELREQMGDNLL
ncbi:hypothetical protein ANO11243_073240 [Dothideomycetidae sp. 11243]|nr:hypothetical protein ANO11243_073240 [fungal sp. No.11243]